MHPARDAIEERIRSSKGDLKSILDDYSTPTACHDPEYIGDREWFGHSQLTLAYHRDVCMDGGEWPYPPADLDTCRYCHALKRATIRFEKWEETANTKVENIHFHYAEKTTGPYLIPDLDHSGCINCTFICKNVSKKGKGIDYIYDSYPGLRAAINDRSERHPLYSSGDGNKGRISDQHRLMWCDVGQWGYNKQFPAYNEKSTEEFKDDLKKEFELNTKDREFIDYYQNRVQTFSTPKIYKQEAEDYYKYNAIRKKLRTYYKFPILYKWHGSRGQPEEEPTNKKTKISRGVHEKYPNPIYAPGFIFERKPPKNKIKPDGLIAKDCLKIKSDEAFMKAQKEREKWKKDSAKIKELENELKQNENWKIRVCEECGGKLSYDPIRDETSCVDCGLTNYIDTRFTTEFDNIGMGDLYPGPLGEETIDTSQDMMFEPEPEKMGDDDEALQQMTAAEMDDEEETHLKTYDDESDKEHAGDDDHEDDHHQERVRLDINLHHAILPKTGRLLYGYIGGNQRKAMFGKDNSQRITRINKWTKENIKTFKLDLEHSSYNAIFKESRFKRTFNILSIEKRIFGESYGKLEGIYLSQIHITPLQGERLINQKKVKIAYNRIFAEADEATLKQLFEMNTSDQLFEINPLIRDQKLETFRQSRKLISKETGITYQSTGRYLHNIYKHDIYKKLVEQMAHTFIEPDTYIGKDHYEVRDKINYEIEIWSRTYKWRKALKALEDVGKETNKKHKKIQEMPTWLRYHEFLWNSEPTYPFNQPCSPLFDYCPDWTGCIDNVWIREQSGH